MVGASGAQESEGEEPPEGTGERAPGTGASLIREPPLKNFLQ